MCNAYASIISTSKMSRLTPRTLARKPCLNGAIPDARINLLQKNASATDASNIWNKTINTSKRQFAVCIDNSDYEASLIPRKIYALIPDERAAQDDLIRVIDESGEDYLFHKSRFVMVDLPARVEKILLTISPAI